MNNNDRRCCAAPLEDGSCCGLPDRHDGEHYSTNEMMKDFVNPSRHEVVRLTAERDAAIAACAEMRAALERSTNAHQAALYDEDLDRDDERDAQRVIDDTHAALSRTDLGRGWASPEDTAQMVGALQMVESDGEFGSLHEVTRKFVVDVLALLRKGGG